MNKTFLYAAIVAIAVGGVTYFLFGYENSAQEITSFEECAAAGNPVAESYPRQCWTQDGKYFVESIAACKGSAECFNGKITQVTDGDTIQVDGIKIRLALTSTPETEEPYGIDATQFAREVCPIGSTALVDEDDGQIGGSSDRMFIAVVYCEGTNLNEALLESGFGKISRRFCDESEFSNEEWAKKYGC